MKEIETRKIYLCHISQKKLPFCIKLNSKLFNQLKKYESYISPAFKLWLNIEQIIKKIQSLRKTWITSHH